MTEEMSVVLRMTESTERALHADEQVLAMLDAYTVDSQEMAVIVNVELQGTIVRIAEIKKDKAEFVSLAKQIIAKAEKLFDPAIEAREQFAQGLRAKLATFVIEQKQIADETRRTADAEARRIQQENEARAAADRARAEEQAAAKRREADELERKRHEALAAGNAKAAAAAAAAAAKATEQAASIIENVEIKAAARFMDVQAAIPVVAAPPKIAGFSLRDNWVAELASGTTEDDARALIVAAIAGVSVKALVRTDLLPQLKRDESAGNKLAKALKGAMVVPGLVAVNRQTSVSRAA